MLSTRRQLRDHSDLGEYGAAAIHRALQDRGLGPLPAPRTIGYILERRGALDGQRRVRRPAPPPGWYLPEVAAGRAELDSFDTVEGLALRGGVLLEILTAISLHGALTAAWPHKAAVTAPLVLKALCLHWQEFGLPAYAQFDNDPIFTGPQIRPDTLGRVTRTCLSLGVVPVFVPPRETGFQAAMESFNGLWQAKVWARFEHAALEDLRARSGRYSAAHRQRRAARIEAAPPRLPFPAAWHLDLQAPPQGRLVFLRRSSARGEVQLLGRTFAVEASWPQRLVRAEVDLTAGRLRFYALRRRAPDQQPLLKEVAYALPRRKFHE